MFNVKRLVVATFATACAFFAQAQPQVPASTAQTPLAAATAPPQAATLALPSSSISASSAAEIQKITEEMTVLNARLSQLELKAKIAAKQKELTILDPSSYSSPLGSSVGSPSVVSVAGLKGQLEAVLVFPGNQAQRVKTGDVIGDRKVASVALNEVVLTDLKGKNIQRLAFGSTAVTKDTGAMAGNNVPGQPGLYPPIPSIQR
jgi:type IV pilus biogenesis protein PilP